MELLKPKNARSKSFLMSILTLLIVTSGCSSFGKKEVIVKSDYCEKHYPLKKSENVKKDMAKISSDSFEYFEVNETTYTCDCLFPEKRDQCYKEILSLKNKGKTNVKRN